MPQENFIGAGPIGHTDAGFKEPDLPSLVLSLGGIRQRKNIGSGSCDQDGGKADFCDRPASAHPVKREKRGGLRKTGQLS
jgi:hypothetical protein